jgi:hypothetical protein
MLGMPLLTANRTLPLHHAANYAAAAAANTTPCDQQTLTSTYLLQQTTRQQPQKLSFTNAELAEHRTQHLFAHAFTPHFT